jgi:two-component system chemotaxis response regulator CheB
MTGMGDDGARGMLEMKEAGAATVAQDEGFSRR